MSAFGGRPQHIVHDENSELLNQQLHHELAQTTDISLPGSRQAHNPTRLGQLSLLPPELLLQVLSYVIVLRRNIHGWRPYNGPWRLTLRPESSFSQCKGGCIYRSKRLGGTVTEYMDTAALVLVSQAMRDTTLDIFFARNHFVFMYWSDLRDFASKFRLAAASIQSLHLCHNVSDSWDFSAKELTRTRRRFKSLRHLELNILLQDDSPYESIYEDGFLKELCHLRRPLPESFECSVQWLKEARYGRKFGLDEGIPKRVQEKLIKIFTGIYGDEIPISTPPPRKVR